MTPILGIMASSISGSKVITGAFESIASVSGTGLSDTITFSSIPSTYTHLQLRFNAIGNGGGSVYYYRFNGDTASNYSNHYFEGNAGSFYTAGTVNSSIIYLQAGGGGATYPTVGILDIHNYASTTNYKTARSIAGTDTNGGGFIDLDSGLWRSTSAITSISITQSSYNFATTTTFSLYGIKGA
jgi:hypothetical protein